MNDCTNIDSKDIARNISQTEEEYDNWNMDIERAKDYSLNIGDMTTYTLNNIDTMRELVSSKDTTLTNILDEKAALLNDMRRKNIDFIDELQTEYNKQNKYYQDKLQGLYDEMSNIDNQ